MRLKAKGKDKDMKVDKIITTTEPLELEITGITLLSRKEYEECRTNIPHINKWWWLRSSCSNIGLYVCVVTDYGTLDYNSLNGDYVGVRPALVMDRKSSNLEIGDKLKIKERSWTVISDRLALCDDMITEMPFKKDWRVDDADDYESSDIKSFIEAWWTA